MHTKQTSATWPQLCRVLSRARSRVCRDDWKPAAASPPEQRLQSRAIWCHSRPAQHSQLPYRPSCPHSRPRLWDLPGEVLPCRGPQVLPVELRGHMTGWKNCGANTSLHLNRTIVIKSWLSPGFINTNMYAEFSHTYWQNDIFFNFMFFWGIIMGIKFFRFSFPPLPTACLKCFSTFWITLILCYIFSVIYLLYFSSLNQVNQLVLDAGLEL